MSNYIIFKKRSKWFVSHVNGRHIYCRRFKFNFMAKLHKYSLDKRGY